MIIIWDNGHDYEDHDIDFIEIGDEPKPVVLEVLRLRDSRGRVLGLADSIMWENGGNRALSVTQACSYLCFRDDPFPRTHDEQMAAFTMSALNMIEQIVAAREPFEWRESIAKIHAEKARRAHERGYLRAVECDVCQEELWKP